MVLTSLTSNHLTALVKIDKVDLHGGRPVTTAAPPDRGRRLTAAEQVAVVRVYQAGSSMAALSGKYGVRRSTISKVLRRTASPLRAERTIAGEEVDEALRLYSQGLSLVRVGERLGYNAETIRKRLKRRGVVLRSASRPPMNPPFDTLPTAF